SFCSWTRGCDCSTPGTAPEFRVFTARAANVNGALRAGAAWESFLFRFWVDSSKQEGSPVIPANPTFPSPDDWFSSRFNRNRLRLRLLRLRRCDSQHTLLERRHSRFGIQRHRRRDAAIYIARCELAPKYIFFVRLFLLAGG